MRVVSRRVGREAPRRPVLDTLIDRQDEELAGAAELALHQDAGEVRLGAGIVAFVMRKNGPDALGELHGKVLEAVAADIPKPGPIGHRSGDFGARALLAA